MYFSSSQTTCGDLPPTSSTDANTVLGSKVSLQRLTEPSKCSCSQNTQYSCTKSQKNRGVTMATPSTGRQAYSKHRSSVLTKNASLFSSFALLWAAPPPAPPPLLHFRKEKGWPAAHVHTLPHLALLLPWQAQPLLLHLHTPGQNPGHPS